MELLQTAVLLLRRHARSPAPRLPGRVAIKAMFRYDPINSKRKKRYIECFDTYMEY